MKITTVLKLTRETPGTFLYTDPQADRFTDIRNLYISKRAFGSTPPPDEVEITVTPKD